MAQQDEATFFPIVRATAPISAIPATLAAALVKARKGMKNPAKEKTNPRFNSKYAPLDAVIDAVQKSLGDNDLMLSQSIVTDAPNNMVGVVSTLIHASGEVYQTEPAFAFVAGLDAQKVGAAVTYLRRYTVGALFGIAPDEDDDGNAVSGDAQEPRRLRTNQQPQGNGSRNDGAPKPRAATVSTRFWQRFTQLEIPNNRREDAKKKMLEFTNGAINEAQLFEWLEDEGNR